MRDHATQHQSDSTARGTILRYVLAVLCLIAGGFLSELLRPALDAAVLLLVAVLIAAWFCGLWPALLVSLLATLTLDYYFTAPAYALNLEFAHIPRLVVFTVLAAFFASASAARRKAELSLTRARDELEIRVVERTAELQQSNEQLQREIVERRRAEETLEDLAGRLIHAQEEERRRIGRELHDHVSQMLGILTVRIDQLGSDGAISPAMARALNELRQGATEIANDVHRLSHRLHSTALDYLGLVPALQKLVNEFSERHEIAIKLLCGNVPPSLPSEVALSLFRIAEECLTNIAKHSNARSAQVSVTGGPDGVRLIVEDTGVGFDAGSIRTKAGLGFVSMQERLRVLHGTVRVDSAPLRGTKIDAWVPAASLVAGASAPTEQAMRSVGRSGVSSA